MKLNIQIEGSSCFCSGQTVQGHAILESSSGDTIKGLSIELIGRATTKWYETVHEHGGRRGRNQTRQRLREQRIQYLANCVQHQITSLAPGHTKVPFAFQLPHGIPSSFNGEYGQVIYFIKATIQRSWKFNIISRQYFSFNAIVDLNSVPGAAAPLQIYKEESTEILWGSGRISASFQLQRSGLVGGQPLNFVLEVRNTSERTVRTINLKLIQRSTFKADGREKTSKFCVMAIRIPPNDKIATGRDRGSSSSTVAVAVPPKEERIFTGSEYMHSIPPLPVSGLGGCAIIDVQYYFELAMNYRTLATFEATTSPIIIGTIPLREFFGNLVHAPSPNTTASAPYPHEVGVDAAAALAMPPGAMGVYSTPGPRSYGSAPYPYEVGVDATAALAMPPGAMGMYSTPGPGSYAYPYPDLPPPSYHEAVMGTAIREKEGNNDEASSPQPSAPEKGGDDDEAGGFVFVPKYAAYDWK